MDPKQYSFAHQNHFFTKTIIPFVLFLIFLIFLLTIISISIANKQSKNNTTKTISVVGIGEVKATNLSLSVNYNCTGKDSNSSTALVTATTACNQLVEALKLEGVKEDELMTNNLSVYNAQYDPAAPVSYLASQGLVITFKYEGNAERLTGIINSTSKIQNALLQGVNIVNKESSKLINTAKEYAIKDAFEKATALAKVGGFRVGKIISINDSGYSNMPTPYMSESTKGGDGNIQIYSGDQIITKQVEVVYEIDYGIWR
jgi:uncharacterized protein